MSVFGERFVLAILVAFFIAVTIYNPMQLDTTQRVSGALAVVFTALFIGHTVYKVAHPPPPVAPVAPIAEERYAVNWDMGIISGDHRSTAAGVYLQSGIGKDAALYPANVAVFLTITNRRNRVVMIKNLSVEMQTFKGEFIELDDLSGSGMIAYGGVAPNNLSLIRDTDRFLENVIKGRQINPYEPIRGWLFLQYPKDIGPRFQAVIRLTISDYSGDPSFTTEPLKAKEEKTSQPAGMLLDAPIDLSHLPIRFIHS
jgi:hypothetical protein